MNALRLPLLLLALLVICAAFDKFSVSKDKNVRANLKHPISRRVLRYERSVAYEDFPTPGEMAPKYVPIMDFAKVRPEIPSKTKHNSEFADSEYQPDLDF
ncbi:unnamed protein product [Caenorhabditis sp. 36 PRJEB53466]|nr:unnamed protein product [Caenorhabditis sp. 36 PRJEB53466]